MKQDRRSLDLALLKKAVDRTKGRPQKTRDTSQMLYRGQPVAGGGGGGGGRAPGAPAGGRSHQRSGSGSDVKESLRNLTLLFHDGLITTAEYDAKRAEILDRL